MKKNNQFIELFDNASGNYVEKYMKVEQYANSLDRLLDRLPLKGRVLDIGCGPGNVAFYALEKRNDLNWFGIDGSIQMIDFARKYNPAADFDVMDCRDYPMEAKNWNGVICSFILPYLSEEEIKDLLNRVKRGLKIDGLFYIATTLEAAPREDVNISLDEQPHYCSENQLLNWLKKLDYQIIFKENIENVITGDQEFIVLVRNN